MVNSPKYAVRTTVFESGERMPLLVDAISGLPVFDPCIYACTEVRPRTGSAATMEQALRGVQFLLTFLDQRQIDLSTRFTEGRFLDQHELDDLVRSAYLPLAAAFTAHPDSHNSRSRMPKVISLERMLQRTPTPRACAAVAASTASIRLYYASEYLKWYGLRNARHVCKSLFQKNQYIELIREFLKRLHSRIPKSRTHSNRMSLTSEQKAELIRLIDPNCPDNPWNEDFVRDRNRLIVLWGLGTGLRRGELLGLKIKLLDFQRNMADIIRRPDDKKDPRKHQPNTKTRERRIGISEELAFFTHQHIVKYRSKIRGAQKHDFLFVVEKTGYPLSLAGLSKVFRLIRLKHPTLGEKLSSHVLRHTWNDDFSIIADKAGLLPQDERRARNHAMGWSEFSNTADHYLKRHTERIAANASIQIQESLIGTKLNEKPNET